MSPTTLALTSAGCIFAGTLVGLALRRFLPDHHLNADSKDAIKVGAGMVTMMAAMVLGLLVSSAKNNFDDTTDAITQSGAKVILLDRVLRTYGPETGDLREGLRRGVATALQILWPEGPGQDAALKAFESTAGIERLLEKIRELKPQSDAQRALQDEARQLCNEILLTRWLQIEQATTSLPGLFLVILLFWLTMLFMSFGLLAPRNGTVITVMFVGALAVASAMFLIMEMNDPMRGAIKVSSGPIRNALEQLSR
jgi:hypothetical protein